MVVGKSSISRPYENRSIGTGQLVCQSINRNKKRWRTKKIRPTKENASVQIDHYNSKWTWQAVGLLLGLISQLKINNHRSETEKIRFNKNFKIDIYLIDQIIYIDIYERFFRISIKLLDLDTWRARRLAVAVPNSRRRSCEIVNGNDWMTS